MSSIRPPFDGEVKVEASGEGCDGFKGDLSKVVIDCKDKIDGVVSICIGLNGTATGCFQGELNLDIGSFEVLTLLVFMPFETVHIVDKKKS